MIVSISQKMFVLTKGILGYFNAKVGMSVEMDDVIGTCVFGEETCNTIVVTG